MSEDNKPKKKRSFDWPALKKEYLTGNYKTLSDFKREKNIPTTWSSQFKGWLNEKKELEKKALEAAKDEIVKQESESIVDVKVRQARLARFMQMRGAEKMEEIDVTDIDDARKLVVTGMQEERKILGMDGKGGAKGDSYLQVNIGPLTNLDKLVEETDYEGLLKLIAELKRERTRRTLPSDDEESDGEVTDGEIV